MEAHWHDHNPWADKVVYVPLEALAEAVAGGNIQLSDGSIVARDQAFMLDHFLQYGDRLDAYILPNALSGNLLGVRYGGEDREYLSPHNCNPELVEELLEKYRDQQTYAPRIL